MRSNFLSPLQSQPLDAQPRIRARVDALVAPDTLARAAALGLKASEFLDRNHAYNFFAPLGAAARADRPRQRFTASSPARRSPGYVSGRGRS
jgi:hypothetical protein